MLNKQSKYLRATTDDNLNSMTREQLIAELERVGETDKNDTNDEEAMKKKLKNIERTRNIMVWLDNSTVANAGYLVCLITCLYDPAVFYTDEEYIAAFGEKVNIQQIIEEPELHFIARCGSSDKEQLLYSETRLECILEMRTSHTTNQKQIKFCDKLRFCHGDMPLRAFEAGQQKGGNFFCASCGLHCDFTFSLEHALNCQVLSLQDRIDTMMQGAVTRKNTLLKKAKPLEGLTKQELEQELASRSIYEGKNKHELQDLLVEKMAGQKRIPALVVNNPTSSLQELGLANYEILPCEPLHDLGHHIENFFAEFPKHLPSPEATLLEDTINLSLAGKDSKRCVDYRITLIKTTSVAHQSPLISEKTLLALDTLVEMQRILYSDDKTRCPSQILRYYNQAWYHSILLYDLIVNNPKKLTLRKMFGVYFHNLSAHAGDMLRLISGQSTNAERQERIFNSVKRITKLTSNYHPGHIIPNLFVRLQAEKEMGLQGNDARSQQAHVSDLSKSLPPGKNTYIPYTVIRKHPRAWQAHLQHISDFLLEGEGVWFTLLDEGVELHDCTGYPELLLRGPQLHHFRSSSLKQEEEYLNSCWKKLLDGKCTIPLHTIRIVGPGGKRKVLQTNFLKDDINTPSAPDQSFDKDHEPEHVLDMPVEPPCSPDDNLPGELNRASSPAKQDHVSSLDERDHVSSPDEQEHVGSHDERDHVISPDEQDQLSPDEPNETVVEVSLSSEEIIELEENAENEVTIDINQSTSSPQYIIQSRLCKVIEIVIGTTNEVIALDQSHLYLKKLKRENKRSKEHEKAYFTQLAQLQTRVLAEKRKAKERLVNWEKDFVLKNGLQSPSVQMMSSDRTASELLKKIKNATALLGQWKISF